MKELGRVWRLFYLDGISLSEISRKTGYSRNTVKQWLRAAEGVEPSYQRKRHDTKIAPYAAQEWRIQRVEKYPELGCIGSCRPSQASRKPRQCWRYGRKEKGQSKA